MSCNHCPLLILLIISLISACNCQPQEPLAPEPLFIPSPISDEPNEIVAPDTSVDTAPTSQCAGISPILSSDPQGVPTSVAPCWQGYWLIDSSVNITSEGYNIEGRILVRGNFELKENASLAWRGFQSTNDSRPDIPLSPNGERRSYLLSHVNVTGDLTLNQRSSILVEISQTELEAILGPINLDQSLRSASQFIVESNNSVTDVTLLLNPAINQDCRQVSVSSKSEMSVNGRFMLSLLINTDDSGCTPGSKKSNNIVKIVVPCVVIGALLIVGAIILAAYKIPAFGKLVLPTRASIPE